MTDYPEHAKLERLGAERTMLNEFLAWLGDQGVHLVSYGGAKSTPTLGHAALTAKFLNIDEDRLETERRAMLDELRETEQCA